MAHGYPEHSEGIDFGRRSDDYARHRPGPPGSVYGRLDSLVPLDGARVLDLGTGPGLIAHALAARGAVVTGVDVSREQIAAAAAATTHLPGRCTFVVAPAEATGLDDAAFDLVVAGQCWHWFDHDAACAEARRVLRPGGLLAVVQYGYLPMASAVARDTEALIEQFNPGWSMAGFDGLYPALIDGLGRADGFRLVEQFCYDYDETFTHETWRGRIRTCHGVGSRRTTTTATHDGDDQNEDKNEDSDDPATVVAFDAALARMLIADHPDEPLHIAHRVWAVVVRRTQDTPR